MKIDLLDRLACPLCGRDLRVEDAVEGQGEIRMGRLVCEGDATHAFRVEEGVVHTAAGLTHDVVQAELAYETSTYHGDPRLTDPAVIAGFPDTLADLWPANRHFGPDFRRFLGRLPLTPGAWVLDLGAGACWSSRLLAQAGAHVVAVDVNANPYYGLGAARIQMDAHGVHIERVVESMACLPFRDGAFDLIVFNAAFHHTPDVAATLRECRRVLRHGGVVAMLNEEFVSFRHRLGRPDVNEEGAHHDIPYVCVDRAARALDFTPRYRVTHHVEAALERRLGARAGALLCRAAEALPWLVWQLNSAEIQLLDARS